MPSIRLSRLAENDLAEISEYIAADNPARADTFEQELLNCAGRIARMPLAFRARPELGEGIRSCPYGHYLLFYRITDTGIRIERILHGARDLLAQFE